jgi:hypothetical protein
MADMLPGALPFPEPLGLELDAAAARVLARMKAAASAALPPPDEAELAAALAAGRVDVVLPFTPDAAVVPLAAAPPLARFGQRPPLEPAIAPLLAAAEARALHPPQIIAAVEALTAGEIAGIRSTPISSTDDAEGASTAFSPPAALIGEIGGLCRLVNAQFHPDPLVEAIVLYACTLEVHPFGDGNGRLSRALFHAVLAARGIAPAPVLPLGPALYANPGMLVGEARRLRATGAWRPFATFMLRLADRVLDAADTLRPERKRAAG